MGCGRGNESSNHSSKRGCVCEVVRSILEIQNAATQNECSGCTTSCFLEPLGGIVSPARHSADTRVFTLLTKSGCPFFATFSSTEMACNVCTSIYFRVEDVFDGCCATLRVLIPLDECKDPVQLLHEHGCEIDMRKVCDVVHFAPSDSCITVDLDCFCAVQCIADVNLGVCN